MLLAVMGLAMAAAQPPAAPPAAQPAPAPASSQVARVQAELEALVAELGRALEAGDEAALERLYAPEFRWVQGFGFAATRGDQLRAVYRALPDRELPAFDFSPPNELIVAGDTAILRQWQTTGRGTAEGVQVRSTSIFVRRGGRWQFLHHQDTALLAFAPEEERGPAGERPNGR